MDSIPILLAQLDPTAGVETLLYQVPKTNRALIQEVVVCNRSAATTSFRFSISKAGVPTTTIDYFYYNLPIGPHDTFATDIGVTLSANDAVRVYATNGNLTFTLIGQPT